MRISTVNRLWRIAGILALALFLGGAIAAVNMVGPGKGGNLGAAMLALLLWLLAFAAALTCAVAFAIARRNRGVPPERGFDVVVHPPDGPMPK